MGTPEPGRHAWTRQARNPMVAWNVYLRGKRIDTVYYDPDFTAAEVRRGLIDHDGYDPAITVRKARKR